MAKMRTVKKTDCQTSKLTKELTGYAETTSAMRTDSESSENDFCQVKCCLPDLGSHHCRNCPEPEFLKK